MLIEELKIIALVEEVDQKGKKCRAMYEKSKETLC